MEEGAKKVWREWKRVREEPWNSVEEDARKKSKELERTWKEWMEVRREVREELEKE